MKQMLESLESIIESFLKSSKKSGTISEQELGAALIDYDLSAKEMKEIISRFTKEGIVVEEDSGKTSKDGVYAGGDAVTGAATVISAMGAGKTAAHAIDEYLKNK